jgi:hypothetical protein
MSSAFTRRRILLGTAVVALTPGLGALLVPGDALACHLYKSPVDGRVGCGAQTRDRANGVSGGSTSTSGTSSPVSEPQSPPPADSCA